MNNRTPILNELQTLAPGLVHLPVTMPYTVPQGYFENFAGTLVNDLTTNDFNLIFLPTDKKMPYEVPAGYFESLAHDILGKVNNRQTVPQGYFESLPALLLNKIRRLEVTAELETVAPLLNTISRQPVQTVPAGYFEQLQPPVRHLNKQATLIVSVNKKAGWLKYAAAASVILLLSFGAYRYFDKPPVIVADIENIDKQLAQLDDAVIENYLQENESVTEKNAEWYKSSQNDDIEDLLQDFTEQELQQQLLEKSEPAASKNPKKI